MTRTRLMAVGALCAAIAMTTASIAHAQNGTKPNAVTQGVTNITQTSAVVHGAVNAHGAATTYYFQYGPTSAYGQRTPGRSAGDGTSGISVQATLSGLSATTAYHYRVVAVSANGTTRGADHAFTTKAPTIPQPSKLELARATINSISKSIDVLAPITGRASGVVNLELYAARQAYRWTARVDSSNGYIRTRVSIPAAQAAMGTGILTINYPGDADTRPQVVRLRAANVHADLNAGRPQIVNGHLQASGTINARARGNVRVQLEYFSGGRTTTIEKYAPISNGNWTLDYALSPDEQAAIDARGGTVQSYVLFTGYLPARMRGEMQSFEVLGAP